MRKVFLKISYKVSNKRGNIEQIHLAYGFPKETVTAIIMLYKNMKAMIRSPDGDINFLNIVAVLQADTLCNICLKSAKITYFKHW